MFHFLFRELVFSTRGACSSCALCVLLVDHMGLPASFRNAPLYLFLVILPFFASLFQIQAYPASFCRMLSSALLLLAFSLQLIILFPCKLVISNFLIFTFWFCFVLFLILILSLFLNDFLEFSPVALLPFDSSLPQCTLFFFPLF